MASGFSALVSTLLIEVETGFVLRATRLAEPLTWRIGDRVLMLGPLLRGLIELAVVHLVAVFCTTATTARGRHNRPTSPKPLLAVVPTQVVNG